MNNRFKLLFGVVAIALLVSSYACTLKQNKDESNLKLWYNSPANFFEETLVMGNGKIGASIFGGVSVDSIYLNDITLWAGEPVDPNMNPGAHEYVPMIQEALENEDYKRADSLSRFVQGKFSESFAPLGTLYLDFDHSDDYTDYYRELDISKAISKVSYKLDKNVIDREYLVSNPDSLFLIKLNAKGTAQLDLNIGFKSLLKHESHFDEDTFLIDGYAPYHAEPGYRGDITDAVRFDPNRGIRFSSYIRVKETDGRVTYSDKGIQLENASFVEILVSLETSFNGFDKDPVKEGKDNKVMAKGYLDKAMVKSVETIKNNHIDDYQRLFDRVDLNLGDVDGSHLPTDERLKKYYSGGSDHKLEELYFKYGRYLLISSSRTTGVPANLQGLWNPYMRPPWSSNYTVNINVEENYWLAENTNLSELHMPFLSWVKNVAENGDITAKTFLGVQEGWMACHNSDIWAMSNPVGDFGQGHPGYANWYLGGGWLSTHIWEHYNFSQDKIFLESYYPILKGSAQFCLNWLIEKNGELITSPSTSPENGYISDNGYKGATLYGATADLAIIREVFNHTIYAAMALGIDHDFIGKIEAALAILRPYQIGKKGNLQEWYHDWEDVDPKHRHQTHLFGLYPGHQINTEGTPGLAEAAKRTLELRGDESTGWSKGWRINLWARLKDGEHAYKMYRELLNYVDPSGLDTNYSNGGGTYPNLLDAHPPFQIDGNFGGAAGVAEMLIQSTENSIEILPALPQEWKTGSFKGLCARGGFEVDAKWEDSQLVWIQIFSRAGQNCKVNFMGQTIEFKTKKGELYKIDKNFELVLN